MNPRMIFLPVFVQVLLTFLVWVWMYLGRLNGIQKAKVRLQVLADEKKADEVFKSSVHASDNFENQFEIPVLFFVAILTIYVLNQVDELYLVLASLFVLFRILHAVIHCGSNRILHRFLTYFISSFLLWAMWFRLAAQVLFSMQS